MTPENPYECALEDDSSIHLEPVVLSDRNAYLIGFVRGACWSILVVPIMMMALYSESYIKYWYSYDPKTNTEVSVDVPLMKSIQLFSEMACYSLVIVTLPWAISAGFAHMLHERKRNKRSKSKSIPTA